jgi:hypothetical protein
MSMIADRKYELMCESIGSRPDASIFWLKGKKPLKKSREISTNNSTLSTLFYTPSTEDDGKTITCRAENPKVTGLFLETTWSMSVYCECDSNSYVFLVSLIFCSCASSTLHQPEDWLKFVI